MGAVSRSSPALSRRLRDYCGSACAGTQSHPAIRSPRHLQICSTRSRTAGAGDNITRKLHHQVFVPVEDFAAVGSPSSPCPPPSPLHGPGLGFPMLTVGGVPGQLLQRIVRQCKNSESLHGPCPLARSRPMQVSIKLALAYSGPLVTSTVSMGKPNLGFPMLTVGGVPRQLLQRIVSQCNNFENLH